MKTMVSKASANFARRNVCIALAIPDAVKIDIARSSWGLEEETMEKVKVIQSIFAKKCK